MLITVGDETGETDFILFGHMAQRIVKRPLDILIADNPARFILDEITRLRENVYTFNVNTFVTEISDGGWVPISPSGSQPSSISSTRVASKSTSAEFVPTEGTSSQTPQSTKTYNKDKVADATSKRWVHSYQEGCEEDIGDSTDKTGVGGGSASVAADSRYILSSLCHLGVYNIV
ncbi:hypothetical protein ZEAMMB73_Zm00001d024860 [Zea mays]|uniref:Uncharacterized protein n=1 Tax=Zea mays TaxID=4577 RepID=A0A1D6J2F7_MAIZE|nr:hypothetical protein ZEAMMB73_Zm00001d024860 [Zea mays]